MASVMSRYPRVSDLEKKAKRSLPPFVAAYLFSGTGQNRARDASMGDYDKIRLVPRYLRGRVSPDIRTSFLNTTFDAPFSVSPIGLSSLIWPG